MRTPLSFKDWEALSAYLDGQLSERDRARLQERVSADPELQRALEGLRQTKIILRSAPRRRAPRNFTLNPKMVPQRRRGWFQPVPAFSFGSVMAAILLIFALAFQYLPGLQGLRLMAAPAPASQSAPQAPGSAALPAPQATDKSFETQPSSSLPKIIIWGPSAGGGMGGGGSGGDGSGIIGGGAPPEGATGLGGAPTTNETATPGGGKGTGIPIPDQTLAPEATPQPPATQAALNGPTPTAVPTFSGNGPILGIQPTPQDRELAINQAVATSQASSANPPDRSGAPTTGASPGGINLGGLQIGLGLLALGLAGAAFYFRRRS